MAPELDGGAVCPVEVAGVQRKGVFPAVDAAPPEKRSCGTELIPVGVILVLVNHALHRLLPGDGEKDIHAGCVHTDVVQRDGHPRVGDRLVHRGVVGFQRSAGVFDLAPGGVHGIVHLGLAGGIPEKADLPFRHADERRCGKRGHGQGADRRRGNGHGAQRFCGPAGRRGLGLWGGRFQPGLAPGQRQNAVPLLLRHRRLAGGQLLQVTVKILPVLHSVTPPSGRPEIAGAAAPGRGSAGY